MITKQMLAEAESTVRYWEQVMPNDIEDVIAPFAAELLYQLRWELVQRISGAMPQETEVKVHRRCHFPHLYT